MGRSGEPRRPPIRLLPRRLPVRWRIALATAGLTMAILVVFAAVVGRLTSDRFQDDFYDELRGAAGALAIQTTVGYSPDFGPVVRGPDPEQFAMPQRADARIVTGDGDVLVPNEAAPLGPVRAGLERIGDRDVATVRIPNNEVGAPPTFVQYARAHDTIDATLDKLWLFLAGGVLGGTLLAGLAGMTVASRAMAPIAQLTATAREIAATRDPSKRIPESPADDEVAELGRTLEQMLRSLDAARSETELTIRRQREFVADASHELRTPLTSILANLEMLNEELTGAEQGEEREMVSSALRSSQRMKRLVSDLLLLARADAGRSAARRRCDLAEIAEEARAEIEAATDDRRLSLITDGAVLVEGAPDELHRMVGNLLGNAARHTPAGTSVEIAVRASGDDAVLEVSDDGPGIPSEIADRLFERFVSAVGDAGEGTGLGLAIVRAVAETHGGSVEARNGAGGGAVFFVRLPLAERAGHAPPSTEPSASGDAGARETLRGP